MSRSSFYYEPKGETEMNLNLMRLIDKQFLETPFYGVRQMTWHLPNKWGVAHHRRPRSRRHTAYAEVGRGTRGGL
jgi:putative transposase